MISKLVARVLVLATLIIAIPACSEITGYADKEAIESCITSIEDNITRLESESTTANHQVELRKAKDSLTYMKKVQKQCKKMSTGTSDCFIGAC